MVLKLVIMHSIGRNPLGELAGNWLETRVANPGFQLVSNWFA